MKQPRSRLRAPIVSPGYFLFAATTVAFVLAGCASSPPPDTRLDDALNRSDVTVYPALVWAGQAAYDHDAARALVPFVKQRTTGEVSASAQEIPAVNTRWGENRARWKIVADAARLHLTTHPLPADQGLWPVYVFVPGTNQVQEIHVLLFDRQGNVVRHLKVEEFATPPHTPAECTDQVMAIVRHREEIYAPKK